MCNKNFLMEAGMVGSIGSRLAGCKPLTGIGNDLLDTL
jgi:hypothetical protein